MFRISGLVLALCMVSGCVVSEQKPSIAGGSASFSPIRVVRNDYIRVVTPFQRPRAVTISNAEIQPRQHVLYVFPSDPNDISMHVIDGENEANSISLTLVPTPGGLREIDLVKMINDAKRTQTAKSTDRPKAVQGSKK